MNSPNVFLDHKTVDTARWPKRFSHASEIMALLVASLGLVVLGGWMFHVPALTYIQPTLQSMKVNTALAFLCLGAGLWLAQDEKRQLSRRILGLLVVAIAGLTLAEYAFHVDLGVDQLLFRDTRTPSLSAYRGRMAIGTASCFLLLGLAVTLLGTKMTITLRYTLVAPCFAFSLVALCGYLYGAKPLYSVTSFSTVGLHTAAGLFAASLAYFLARPEEGIVSIAAKDTNSGLLLRTLFPAIVAMPILIGWLKLEGQRANLYDTQFGVALLVLVGIGSLATLTVLIARSMHRFERERSRAEAARMRSAAIVESSDDAIIGTDVNGTISDWNQGAERLFGYLASEAIGKSISFLTLPGQFNQAQSIFRNVISGDVVKNYEIVRQRKDGTPVEISLTASPILNAEGRVVGASGIARDITEHKQYEEALRASEEKFRSVFRDAGIGMVIVSPEGRFLAVNRTFCDCLGYTEEELLDRSVESITYPEDWPVFAEKLSGALRGGLGFQWLQKRCLHKSGRIVYTETTTSVIRNGQGDPLFFVGQVLDITSRKKAEEAVSDMARKLIDAQEQERARIARELHDDINQRLALLAVQLDQLRNTPSDVQSRVNDLQKQTIEISRDVQTLSHQLHSSKLEYLGVIGSMKSWCREVSERQKMEVTFKTDVSSVLPPEIGLSLFRILQEALHNAAKHSGAKRVEVQLAELSNEVHLAVSDSGKGFDVEAALQNKGLGLTSMRERVRLVNGRLNIESRPMHGTEIHVYVPLDSQQHSERMAG